MISQKSIRESFRQVIKSMFAKRLCILWLISIGYVLVITLIFYNMPFWKNIYIKDIVVWFIFSGLMYCVNAIMTEADEHYISKILKDNVKASIFIEFLMSTFTFNIWIELAIIPIVTVISIINMFLEKSKEYEKIRKLLETVLTIGGFWILYKTIKIGMEEYKQLNIVDSLIGFMIPIIYLILIIPLEYALELYSKYEMLFCRMSLKEENDKKIKKQHRWLIIKNCRFSVHKIVIFQKKYWKRMYSMMSLEEFQKLIEVRRSIRKYATDKKVTKEELMEMIGAAQEAPSWKNTETGRYYCVLSEEMTERVRRECLPEGNARKAENAVLVVTTFVKDKAGFQNDKTADNELGNGWGCYDLGLQNENFVLKAAELGYGTLIMGLRDGEQLRKVLDIPEEETVVAVIAVGVAAEEPKRPRRKGLDEIVKVY